MKIEPEYETLQDGTKGYWVGSRSAASVLLYFHGGGYNASLAPNHLEYLYQHCEYLNGHGSPSSSKPRSYAVLILSYDVAPYATYPRQLAQAAMMLNHLLTTLNRPASKILIGGDSAGGHLSVNLLAHMLHPHPDRSVPEIKLPEGQKLAAALLISPWVEFSTHAPAFKRNAWKDILPIALVDRWSGKFMGGAPRDSYNSPLTAPRDWWSGLNGILSKVYVCGGSDEVLIDDIIKFKDILQGEWNGAKGDFQYNYVEGEPHDSILCDRMMGYKADQIKMDGVVKSWLEESVPV